MLTIANAQPLGAQSKTMTHTSLEALYVENTAVYS